MFFVDPYLDADFVSRYLPYVAEGVSIRLLGGPKKRATLLPAVDSFAQQYGRPVTVRVSDGLHDRYLFIYDEAACYLSGASFKDGAKNAPAVLTQITDAFEAMWNTYQRRWNESGERRMSIDLACGAVAQGRYTVRDSLLPLPGQVGRPIVHQPPLPLETDPSTHRRSRRRSGPRRPPPPR